MKFLDIYVLVALLQHQNDRYVRTSELLAKSGLSKTSLNHYLKFLIASGDIIRVKRGWYGIALTDFTEAITHITNHS